MTLHEQTISKIRQLPEDIVQQVNEFVDFLIMGDDDDDIRSLWEQFCAVSDPSGIKCSDYSVQDEYLDDNIDIPFEL